METAIQVMFIVLTLAMACALFSLPVYLAYQKGLRDGAIRERKRRDFEVLDRAMERVRRLAGETPEIWETEIDG